MTVPVHRFAVPAEGTVCEAGFRRALADAADGSIVSTISTWRCEDPARWIVPIRCPSCGAKATLPYCGIHTAQATGGAIRCLFCPDVTAEVDHA